MKRNIFLAFFLLAICACQHQKKIDEKALSFNKKATNIFVKNIENADSLNLALSLVDSAISIQPDYVNFYSMKITLLNKLNRYDEMIGIYDKILQLRKNYSLFLMGKGIAFEHLNKSDSANQCYHLALDHIEDLGWKKEADKDIEKAIIYKLLRDTISFNAQLGLIKKKYSNEKDFPVWYEYLKTFDRNEIIDDGGAVNKSYPDKVE